MFLSISSTVKTMLRNQLVLNKSLSVRWKKKGMFFWKKRENEWIGMSKIQPDASERLLGWASVVIMLYFALTLGKDIEHHLLGVAAWKVERAPRWWILECWFPQTLQAVRMKTSLIDQQIWTGVNSLWIYQKLSWGLFSLNIDHFTDLHAILVQKPWYKTQWCILF